MATYTTKIIKAGSLLEDTKALLAQWDAEGTVEDNLQAACRENLLGKASRSRAEHVVRAIRERYFTDVEVGLALVHLAQHGWTNARLNLLLYFFTGQSDRLIYDFVVEEVYPLWEKGLKDMPTEFAWQAIARWIDDGETTTEWGEYTALRVARGLLATLRDFGILEGEAKKSIAAMHVPAETCSFIAFYLMDQFGSGQKVLEANDWRLFFWEPDQVERNLVEAEQKRNASCYY